MKRAILDSLLAAQRQRTTVVLATDLNSGEQHVVSAGSPGDTLAAAARETIRNGRSGVVQLNGRQVFLHVLPPPIRVLIVGGNETGMALVAMAHAAGYDALLIDPRAALADPDRIPAHLVVRAWPDSALSALRIDSRTAVVAVSHDPKLDDPALHTALASEAFYLGALGGRQSARQRGERLVAAGFSVEEVARIHAPVGLALGAVTPGEIAVAILAEIVSVHRTTPA